MGKDMSDKQSDNPDLLRDMDDKQLEDLQRTMSESDKTEE